MVEKTAATSGLRRSASPTAIVTPWVAWTLLPSGSLSQTLNSLRSSGMMKVTGTARATAIPATTAARPIASVAGRWRRPHASARR